MTLAPIDERESDAVTITRGVSTAMCTALHLAKIREIVNVERLPTCPAFSSTPPGTFDQWKTKVAQLVTRTTANR